MKKRLMTVFIMSAALVAVTAPRISWAAVYDWRDPVDAAWDNPNNWWTAGGLAMVPPEERDDVHIDSYDWSFAPIITSSIGVVTIRNLDVQGHTFNPSPQVLEIHESHLLINNGTFNTLGTTTVNYGLIAVSGYQTIWKGQDLQLGTSGAGYGDLNVGGGAVIYNRNVYVGGYSSGYATLIGASRWIISGTLTQTSGYITLSGSSYMNTQETLVNRGGAYYQGNISLNTGAVWENNGNLTMASTATSYIYLTGTSQLRNGGTIFMSPNAYNGSAIGVQNGSQVTSNAIVAASGQDSGASININGSVWNNSGTLQAASGDNSIFTLNMNSGKMSNGDIDLSSGADSQVELRLTAQSNLSAQNATIAGGDNSQATISLNNNSSFSIQDLALAGGPGASGTIAIAGGSVLSDKNATVATGAGSQADIELRGNGSKWNTSGNLTFSSGSVSLREGKGTEVNVGGTLQMASGAGVSNIQVNTGARLNVGELVLGSGSLELGGDNRFGNITGALTSGTLVFGNDDGGTNVLDGTNNYVADTVIKFKTQVVLNNADASFGTGNVTNSGAIHFGSGNFGTLTVNGNYTGDNGVIYMNSKIDGMNSSINQLIIQGNATGHTMLFIKDTTKLGGPTTGNGIEIVSVGGTYDADAFELNNNNPFYSGMYMYELEQVGQGWYLVGTRSMDAPNAILSTAGAAANTWFAQLGSLNKRLGEVRYQEEQGLLDYIKNGKKGGDVGADFWAKAYGMQSNIKLGISGVDNFTDYVYGLDLGADKTWILDKNNSLAFGYFVGYGANQRNFKHDRGDGKASNYYTGFYSTWLHSAGWYADTIIKGQYTSNEFNASGGSGFRDHGEYNAWNAGASFEVGKRFQFKNGYFLEPAVQASYLRLFGTNYESDVAKVKISDADILRFWAAIRTGWTFKVSESGNILQPYIRIGAMEQISSGNKVQIGGNADDSWRVNTDGFHVLGGLGLMFQVSDVDQLHLDYEAAFGDKFDTPWNINLGYRHQF